MYHCKILVSIKKAYMNPRIIKAIQNLHENSTLKIEVGNKLLAVFICNKKFSQRLSKENLDEMKLNVTQQRIVLENNINLLNNHINTRMKNRC
jgi:hypothetical protein